MKEKHVIETLGQHMRLSAVRQFGIRLGIGIVIPIWFMLCWSGCRHAFIPEEAVPDLSAGNVRQAGLITDPSLTEASGMSCSRRERGLIWMVNDGGHPSALSAFTTDGRAQGSVIVQGAVNRDWEDLAGFDLDGQAYILIADVGDNQSVRDFVRIYVVAEPERQASGAFPAAVVPAWQFRFRYEDGPRDCEAVAVDTMKRQILLLTKRTSPPLIYELPLHPSDEDTMLVARQLGKVSHIPPPSAKNLIQDPVFGVLYSQPTALDICCDNRMAVVLTYKEAYLFGRAPGETWDAAMAGEPLAVGIPQLKQMETICFSANCRTLYVSTEKLPAPILEVDLSRVLRDQ